VLGLYVPPQSIAAPLVSDECQARTGLFLLNLMPLDQRSETLLAGVHPLLAAKVRQMIAALTPKLKGGSARVISGVRTYAQQDAEYAKGRFGHLGPRVTNAKGGQSNHCFALAVDLGIFDATGKYLPKSPLYDLIPPAAHAVGLESGADWKHLNDRPHVQLPSDLIKNGSPTNACRALYAKGGIPAIFAHINSAAAATEQEAAAPVAVGNTSRPDAQPPILRKGSKGAEVTKLQTKLRSLGYTLPIDGDYGSRTEVIVKRFQGVNHLEVDGVCGKETWKALGI
jgi:hypothetical protein